PLKHARPSMSRRLRPFILRFDSLPSTNTEAARQAALGADEGLCVVAREQTKGRGRLGRVWVSPPDAGLYFSVVLRPGLDARAWPLLTLSAALSVGDALSEACGVEADIKWPNDLLAGGRKLCGILAEAVETPRGRACVLGVGINLTRQSFPPELETTATSVESLTGTRPDVEAVLRELLRALSERYARLHEPDGGAETIKEWSARSTYAEGRRVRVKTDAGTFEGTTRGLEPDGALRVETPSGDIQIVRAGDVETVRHT
ncbi:MAG TPA: biotin--[acetyl-CoA-carboxylase] ligase, partial [Pyrinomonadaceae bacterium]|nr:biotin--[acetyl-CoA-carboxylase] ligase [Pyrinomonadaceae bacterium]